MEDKKTSRRYARAERRINRAKGTKREKVVNRKYGYNYEEADRAGIKADSNGHYPSRNPDTGEILKGKKHPTINKTKKAERKLGYKIRRRKGKLYSFPKDEKR